MNHAGNIETIWNEYRSGIQAFLRSRVSNAADVDDLLQEILLKSFEKLSGLRSDGSVRAWLFQIANHAIIDYYRRNARQSTEALPADLSAGDLRANAETGFESEDEFAAELAQCIRPFLKALPAASGELLAAIELDGVSQKAYAEQHGLKYSTLKSRVQKSRAELRDLFERCCRFQLNAHGAIVDYERKSGCADC